MKPVKTLLVAALAAAGMGLAIDAEAARGYWGGGHWGGHFYGPRIGLYIGAPLLWSSFYWGYPYGYGYYYPRTVIYREVERYPEGYIEPAPATTEVPRGPGAPTRAPAYMNYCDSAKAYFPKVTSCPEGWRFEPAR